MSRSLNPYIAGNPVGNSNAFTGRADIIREVLHIFSRPEVLPLCFMDSGALAKPQCYNF